LCIETEELKATFAANSGANSSRRLRTAVDLRGIVMGRYRVRLLTHQHGLRSSWRRKFIHPTDSKHALPISANVLDRQLNPMRPNQAWVADITDIQTCSGWLYLAVVLDLYARKVVAWTMAPDMQEAPVCQALQLAVVQRQPPPGLIVLTDRGSRRPW
jgi:putative transposase